MSDTINDWNAHRQMRREQGHKNVIEFLRVMRRLGIHVSKMDDSGVHCKVIIAGKEWNVWPTTERFRMNVGSNTLDRLDYFYMKYCNVPRGDLPVLKKEIKLRPSVYTDACEGVRDKMTTLQSIRDACLTVEEVIYHTIAWKYFFGPYKNRSLIWTADSEGKNLLPKIEFDGYIPASEHGFWNNEAYSVADRCQNLVLMACIAEDCDAYKDVF
jgi:hypothetical protein